MELAEEDTDREDVATEVSRECSESSGSRIWGRVVVILPPPSVSLAGLPDFTRALTFFPPLSISFKGSFPLRRLSFDREFLECLESGSCDKRSSNTILTRPSEEVLLTEEWTPKSRFSPGDALARYPGSGSELARSRVPAPELRAGMEGVWFERQMKAEPVATTRVAMVVATRTRGSLCRPVSRPSCSLSMVTTISI
jgi:hypothetical protein